jgi:hypothetical protein
MKLLIKERLFRELNKEQAAIIGDLAHYNKSKTKKILFYLPDCKYLLKNLYLPIVNPLSTFMIVWNIILCFCNILMIIFIPLYVCFNFGILFSYTPLLVFFSCDILIRCRKSFYESGELVTDTKAILSHYLKSNLFLRINPINFY